ncbi:unnamed protein product [Diamesa serratosioi]
MDHDHHNHHMPSMNATTALPATMDHSGHNHHMMEPTSNGDHSAHGHGDGTAHDMMNHMMSMAFHGGCNETILFEQWKTSSTGGLVASMIVIFIMGVCYEGLKYYREHLFWKSYNALQYRAVTVPEKNSTPDEAGDRVVHMIGEVVHKQPPTIFSKMHFYQSVLHLIQVTLSFILMLIFMTYNTWLCAAVVFGAMAGYFLFGWKKSVVVDVTEHCH